ncbi:MAG TPA: hypothetical protein VFO94_04755, partial [Gammaproteobacteria bacterium]|nr:hypothetical protein [Gammaproteobacteria bacterium]
MRKSFAASTGLLLAALLLTTGAGAQPAPPVPAAGPYVIPSNAPANVRRAVQSPERTPEMTARDYWRKPAEILTAAGIKDGHHIVEIAGFGQYFTTMLAAAVGPRGKVD